MGEVLRNRLKQRKLDDPALDALLNLLVASGHLRDVLERRCNEFGITRGQYNVLRILRGVHPDGYARGEIISRMVERAPDVTRLIDRLEDQGLVERIPSQQDRRLSISRITERGLELVAAAAPRLEEVNQELGKKLGEAGCRKLSALCEKIYGDTE